MTSDWAPRRLKDVAVVNPRRHLTRGAIAPFVSMASVGFFERDLVFDEVREFKGSGPRFANGDTLVARITPSLENGKGGLGRSLEDGAVAFGSTEFIVLAPADERTDAEFLYYVTRWSRFRNQMIGRMEGTSGRQRVPNAAVEEFEFRCPLVDEQRAIAALLGALDDKIELNRSTCETLESLESALFDQHFVHQAGEGWDLASLPDLAEFVNGRSFTKGASGDGRMVVRIAELNSGPGGSTVYNDVEADLRHIVRPGDLLFAWSGSLGVHRWFRDEALINQHIFKVTPKDVPSWFVHGHLRRAMPFFRSLAADKATTMGHIKREHLALPIISLPPHDVLAIADRLIAPLRDEWLECQQEVLSLIDIRDSLLPKLISGELRVADAEGIVEAVT